MKIKKWAIRSLFQRKRKVNILLYRYAALFIEGYQKTKFLLLHRDVLNFKYFFFMGYLFFSAGVGATSVSSQGSFIPNTAATTIDSILSHRYTHRFEQLFKQKSLTFPPKKMLFIGMKLDKKLEIWVQEKSKWIHLNTYPILKSSGSLGPKRRSGDFQIPEGFYRISALNPYSHYHLSMKINYPNAFDKKWALFENRKHLGGDIFIHGSDRSIGCIALGDHNIEEVYFLASSMPQLDIDVILLPYDPQKVALKPMNPQSNTLWIKYLYLQLQEKTQRIRGY